MNLRWQLQLKKPGIRKKANLSDEVWFWFFRNSLALIKFVTAGLEEKRPSPRQAWEQRMEAGQDRSKRPPGRRCLVRTCYALVRIGHRAITAHSVLQIASLFLLICGQVSADDPAMADPLVTVVINTADQSVEVSGRILIEAQDGGVLLEERNGRIRQLTPALIESKTTSDVSFSAMTNDELGSDLLSQVPDGFEIHQTDHYVICSNSAEEYSEFVGKLLEKVFEQYFEFMSDQEIVVRQPAGKLPVIIFQSEAEFKEFATAQHPETSFEDTPGYYSLRENQVLLQDLTRDRGLRSSTAIRKKLSDQPLQVATMVHEAIHQLSFNTGLQIRMADNPVWLSEGLALYFEPIAPRSSSLWTRPGLVSGRHHPVFVTNSENGSTEISFRDLLSVDNAFLSADTVAMAYAESWGLTSYLFRQQKEGMKKYLTKISQRKPLQRVSPDERVAEFEEAFGKSTDEIEHETVSFVRRLRPPR